MRTMEESYVSYLTLDNELVDLTGLTPTEAAFFSRCYQAWRNRMPWCEYSKILFSDSNPVLEPGRRVTKRVTLHPLWKATRDLEDRVGVLSGDLAAEPGDDAAADPLADELVTVEGAAEQRGVTRAAVYLAIERGDLIATKSRPQRVSQRSLDRWTVNAVRQRAGRGEPVLA